MAEDRIKNLGISRSHETRIAFGIKNDEVELLREWKYPQKDHIKLIIKCCQEYLEIEDEEIEQANKEIDEEIEQKMKR